MKFYLKILVLFLAAASLFTACGLRTDTFNDDTKIPLREGDTLSVQISLEYPSGSKVADSLMRKSILTAAFDMEEDPTTVEETASKYESNLEDAYFTEAQDSTGILRTDTKISDHILSNTTVTGAVLMG